jgi:hypothetical protein
MKEYNGYELFNRDEMTEYTFNFWLNWGAFNHEERDDTEIKGEIFDNLGTKDGIERELDYLRQEFESGWDEDSQEYEDLDQLWNYLNWYKTDFYKRNEVE